MYMSVTLTLNSQRFPPRINTISVELLSLIFRFSRAKPWPHLGTVDLHRQNLSIVPLSAVCRLWRDVAIGDAVLWCNIAFSTSRSSTIRCAAEFLRRSRGAMITVQIFDIRSPISYNKEACDLIDGIAQQSDRIAKFEAVGLSPSIAEGLVYPARNLVHLAINGHGAEELPLIFDGRMPRLKRLTLSNPTGWRLRAFQDVIRVDLVGSGTRIRLSSLTDFLCGATNLEQLFLSRIWDSKSERRKMSLMPIALPSLLQLRISHCNAPRILECLELSPSTRVSILADYDPNNLHILHYLQSEGNFRHRLYDTRSLSVVLHPTNDDFHLVTRQSDDEPACFLQVYDDRERLDERWVLRSVDAITRFKPFFHIKKLTISVESCSVPWRQWLPRLDHLVSADVCSADVAGLVLALSRVHPRHGGPVCPSLRYFSIERKGCGPASDSSILKLCLLARSQAGHPISWLKFRSWDWTLIDQTDLGWKVLIRSQGRFCVFSVFVYIRLIHYPETTDGATAIFMNN